MKNKELQALFRSLDNYEIDCLKQSQKVFEIDTNIRFTSVQAYMNHLAMMVIDRQNNGEFVPRHIDEARAGRYLL
ncbi:hypothetical protein [sulfur-oxidizing endosymbiont of Gigantopelta aegis]|uniref:hypothetical protein n=1 Tax=sulfur-oxidizing endosymbiont of Gigantopelta aegis TaxID=2794934 RepID=UPI0018DE3B4C|nr:hypothetical protein [sulfur-oxidizing endosymbiont of Gigantopelta aegis]